VIYLHQVQYNHRKTKRKIHDTYIINSGNRLNTNLLADGSIYNAQLQILNDLDTANTNESHLQTQSSNPNIQTNTDSIATNLTDISARTA
jgi:hypothetical protein